MDVEIRQEYIKIYPPVKELFDLLDKGNPNVYKRMHVYIAAAEKLIASVEIDYACFNHYAEQYLQLVKKSKEQKSKSTARLREYREHARAEMYALDFIVAFRAGAEQRVFKVLRLQVGAVLLVCYTKTSIQTVY